MGEYITLKCDKCDYSKKLKVGQGLRDHDLTIVASYFDEEYKLRVLSARDGGGLPIFHWEIAFCRECNEYTSVPVLDITGKDLKEQIMGKCECGHKICESDIVNRSSEYDTFDCPLCKGKLLLRHDGYWD